MYSKFSIFKQRKTKSVTQHEGQIKIVLRREKQRKQIVVESAAVNVLAEVITEGYLLQPPCTEPS